MAVGGALLQDAALASKACDLGRIRSNGVEAKPAREVHVGDKLEVKNGAATFKSRCSRSARCAASRRAQTLYRESEASRAARAKAAEERKAMQQFAPLPSTGPPSATAAALSSFAAEGDGFRAVLQ